MKIVSLPKDRLHYSAVKATHPFRNRPKQPGGFQLITLYTEKLQYLGCAADSTFWFILKSFKRIYKYSDWLLISFLICCLFSLFIFFSRKIYWRQRLDSKPKRHALHADGGYIILYCVSEAKDQGKTGKKQRRLGTRTEFPGLKEAGSN